MSQPTMKSTHINLVLAAEVASGRDPKQATLKVGTAVDSDGNWYDAYVAFDRTTGVARVSGKTGATTLNFRPQAAKQA